MKNDILIQLQDKNYGGQYVALWRDKVIASAQTSLALQRKLDRMKLGRKVIDFMQVPSPDIVCVY